MECDIIEYRVEKKYIVSDADLALLNARLKVVMTPDIHQNGSSYEIRSLYFDDLTDSCMCENEAGVDQREKYRIRIYGSDSALIRLEIKEKLHTLTRKESCPLSKDCCRLLLNNSLPFYIGADAPFNRFQLQRCCRLLQPKIIIAYERSAFVCSSGNVRITFDRNIRASKNCFQFLDKQVDNWIPILPTGVHVLEVKYDEFLPESIAQQLEIRKLFQTSFSKYYLGRLAAEGSFPSLC